VGSSRGGKKEDTNIILSTGVNGHLGKFNVDEKSRPISGETKKKGNKLQGEEEPMPQKKGKKEAGHSGGSEFTAQQLQGGKEEQKLCKGKNPLGYWGGGGER